MTFLDFPKVSRVKRRARLSGVLFLPTSLGSSDRGVCEDHYIGDSPASEGCTLHRHRSRHEVPKTPGKKTIFKMHDPARVSHLPVRQSVRHPSGVAGIEPHRNPESSGLRPSTSGLKNGHPCRGASYPTLPDELNDFCKDQIHHLWIT